MAATTTMTPEHCRARYAGVAQTVVAFVAVCFLRKLVSPLFLVASGIVLMLSSPTNLAWRASVNWWVCALCLLLMFFPLALLWFASLAASSVPEADAHQICGDMATARGNWAHDPQVAESQCSNFQWWGAMLEQHEFQQSKTDSEVDAGNADTRPHDCQADCMMNVWQAHTDDTSAFYQDVHNRGRLLVNCVSCAVLVGCAWISSRAYNTPGAPGLGEPQDLPDHRMSPSAAIVRGVRKTFMKAGRASRSEYWCYVMFVTATLSGSAWCHSLMENVSVSQWMPTFHNGTVHPDLLMDEFAAVFSACTMLVQAALSALLLVTFPFATMRRLHDTGRSGWRLLLVLVTFAGLLVVLFWLIRGSEPRRNAYGSVPTTESSWYESDVATPAEAELKDANAEIARLKSKLAAGSAGGGVDTKAEDCDDCESPLHRDSDGVQQVVAEGDDLPEHVRHAVD